MSEYLETASWSTVQRRVRKALRDNLIRPLKEGGQEHYWLSHRGDVTCAAGSKRGYFAKKHLLLWTRQGPDAGASLADKDARMQEVFCSVDWETVRKWIADRPAPYEKIMRAMLQVTIDSENEYAMQDPVEYVRQWIMLPKEIELISVEEENTVPRDD